MERSLLWGACALAFVGLLCGPLLAPRRSGEASPRFPLLAALLPLLVFAATLPSAPPFSPGQGWGRGFLLGGLAAALAGWIVLRAPFGAATGRAAIIAAPCWAALAAVAVMLLLGARGAIVDALLGVAMGWLTVSFVLGAGAAGHLPTLASGAGYAVALCALAALGVYRDALSPEVAPGTWSAVAVALGAGVPFALLLAGALPLPSNNRNAAWLRVAVALLALVLLAAALSAKVLPGSTLFPVVVLGLALGLVAWWTLRDARPDGESGEAPFWMPPLLLALLLAGFMAAYQMLQGFGVGLMLLAAWLPASLVLLSAPPERDDDAFVSGLIRLLLAGVVLLLYRLFATRFAHDLRGVTLTDHYALFGLLLGAALPGLLARVLVGGPHPPGPPLPILGEGGESGGSGKPFGGGSDSFSPLSQNWERGAGGVRAFSLLLAGAATLAAPGLAVLLWGAKCALALLAGLALGAAGAFEGGRTGMRSREMIVALLAVAVALALAQWTGHVLPLADMTRAVKIRVLAAVIAALVALVAVSGWRGRRQRGGALR